MQRPAKPCTPVQFWAPPPNCKEPLTGKSEVRGSFYSTGRYQPRLVRCANVDLARDPCCARVAVGGHGIPEGTVCRRFTAGLRYFFTFYRFRVDVWALYGNDAGPRAHARRPTRRRERGRARPGGVCGIAGKGGLLKGSRDGRLEP